MEGYQIYTLIFSIFLLIFYFIEMIISCIFIIINIQIKSIFQFNLFLFLSFTTLTRICQMMITILSLIIRDYSILIKLIEILDNLSVTFGFSCLLILLCFWLEQIYKNEENNSSKKYINIIFWILFSIQILYNFIISILLLSLPSFHPSLLSYKLVRLLFRSLITFSISIGFIIISIQYYFKVYKYSRIYIKILIITIIFLMIHFIYIFFNFIYFILFLSNVELYKWFISPWISILELLSFLILLISFRPSSFLQFLEKYNDPISLDNINITNDHLIEENHVLLND